MAFTRFAMKIRSKSKQVTGTRHVNYLTREGEYAPGEKDVKHMLRYNARGHNYDHTDLVHVESFRLERLPWAENNPVTFFQGAYTHERANGRIGVAFELGLPRALERPEQIQLTRDFIQAHFPDNPGLFVLHVPIASDYGEQPHAHILVSERVADASKQTAQKFFKQANSRNPSQGGARKDPWMHHPSTPVQLRQSWSDLTNFALERSGSLERVNPLSLKDTGLATPGYDRGVKAERQAERLQRDTPAAIAREAHLASELWTARKAQLGITSLGDHDQFVAESGERVRQRFPVQASVRAWQTLAQLRETEQTLTLEIVQEQRTIAQMNQELATLAREARSTRSEPAHPATRTPRYPRVSTLLKATHHDEEEESSVGAWKAPKPSWESEEEDRSW